MNDFLLKIHRENIYDNIKDLMLFNPEGNNVHKCLDAVFGSCDKKNVLIIEVGSWKGSSAIAMANYLLAKNITPTILCVDTFGGSYIHRESEYLFSLMQCQNGFPTLYKQFISNVVHAKLQDYIVPVPHTSLDSFRYLKKLQVLADFCYIDACHEFEEVYQDIKNYQTLMKKDGIVFGDDYDSGWPGVVSAVDKFVNENDNLKLELQDSQWIIRENR